MGLRLLLVGCGRMGGALLQGWLDGGSVVQVIVVDPSAPAMTDHRVAVLADPAAIPADFRPDAVVLAVKPQMMAAVLPAYRHWAAAGSLFVSIAAGWTLSSFAKVLGDGAAVVRSMPNTPAAIGRGMTVAVANAEVDATGRELAAALLAAVGEVAWIADEVLMDAVTAVSGSGPAYVFLLAEVMTAAGKAAGLPPELAEKLARATVSGAGALLDHSADSAAVLRQNVTSPGGTTAAALQVLMAENGMQALFERAIAAAAARSRELAT